MDTTFIEPDFDVVVCGGGTAGSVAAIAAARQGMHVCLIEQTAMLGGNGTSGLVTQIFGPKKHFGGIGKEVIDRLHECGGVGPTVKPGVYWWVPYRNEYMKRVWDDMVSESGVNLYLCTKLVAVKRNGNRIDSVVAAGPEGCFGIRGKVFVDTTGDGMLSFLAGEEYLLGDEEGRTQGATIESYYANVNFEKYREFIQREGGDYVKVFHRYITKAVEAGVLSETDLHHPGSYRIGGHLALLNVGHVYGADCTSAEGLTQATITGRRQAHEYIEFYRRYIPGFENAELIATGSWLGIRESRRIICQYVVRYDDKKEYRKFEDAVLRYDGGSKTDLHAVSAKPEDYQKYFSMFTAETAKHDPDDFGTLPYRALAARNNDNLLVAGRCLSAEREAQATLRLMGYCMMMGQVAGTAAAASVNEQTPVSEIDIPVLQQRLRGGGLANTL